MEALEDYILFLPGVLSSDECQEIIELPGKPVPSPREFTIHSIKPPEWLAPIYKQIARSYRKVHNKLPPVEPSVFLRGKYETGQGCPMHVDESSGVLSVSVALNDDYEGGEWSWFNGGVQKRAPAGTAVVFPANFMFPHEIVPILKGERHALITWLKGRST